MVGTKETIGSTIGVFSLGSHHQSAARYPSACWAMGLSSRMTCKHCAPVPVPVPAPAPVCVSPVEQQPPNWHVQQPAIQPAI